MTVMARREEDYFEEVDTQWSTGKPFRLSSLNEPAFHDPCMNDLASLFFLFLFFLSFLVSVAISQGKVEYKASPILETLYSMRYINPPLSQKSLPA